MSETLTDLVIARVKAAVPALQSRVAETADLAELIAKGQLPANTPALFVVWAGEKALPNDMDNAVRQVVIEQTSLILVTKNAGDKGGAKGAAEGRAIADDLISAMVGWQPSPNHDPCEYAGGRLLGLQAGAVFIELNFNTRGWLRA